MILIDGKKVAAELREELKQEVAELKNKYNKVPGLTVILIGDLTPSQIYVRNKEKSAKEVLKELLSAKGVIDAVLIEEEQVAYLKVDQEQFNDSDWGVIAHK